RVIDAVAPGHYPAPLDAWHEGREVPKLAKQSFRDRWKELAAEEPGADRPASAGKERGQA
ncbi:MAG TPA: hypothetical protein VK191_16460, partial [Symbiobacteriaceae bacterium]|nr:hypothetical protein [Symbiobacteriaceae bacterium]